MTQVIATKARHILPLLPLLVALACSTSTGAAPGTLAPSELTVHQQVTFGTGKFILDDPKVGLADLSSYAATLTLSFDGTKDSKPQKWTKTYVMLVGRKPAVRQFTLQRTGDLTDLSTLSMAEQAGASYTWDDTSGCTATAINTGSSLGDRLEPAGFLHYVVGAVEAGSATVNKVASQHYTFDQHALGLDGVTESTGEVWVAATGGYVVKYLLSSKGKTNYFGEGIEGTITYDYELTDVNKAPMITLPADCPPGFVNAPQLPDATNVESMPGVLSYDTSSKMKDVVAFYTKSLKDLGWKPQGQPAESDTEALLDYVQGGQVMTVVVSPQDSTTSVMILAGQPTPAP